MRNFAILSSLGFVLTVPSFAGVTISNPIAGATVQSPFQLSALSGTCSSQSIASMSYWLDSSTTPTVLTGATLDTTIVAPSGAHTVHVQATGESGSVCVAEVNVTVFSNSTANSIVPTNATSISSIQTLKSWIAQHDTGGKGKSSGSTSIVKAPSLSGSARKFVTKFENGGDERYSVSFADDQADTNFLYDAWVYFDKSSTAIGNLEMDINQVMPNGENAIFAFQCAGYDGVWEYTQNAGTPQKPIVKWTRSTQPCNPRSWTVGVWHNVQIAYSRDDNGMVTYQSVWLDGAEQDLNVTVPSAFALGWAPVLQTQFQVDGFGKDGTTTVYLDDLTVYSW
jgi:hypothetical protein